MNDAREERNRHECSFVEACSRVGIKATAQRKQIYAALRETDEHPDAETIHAVVKQRIPSLSLDTVYRNLRLLDEHGIIQRVGATGYRSRFDANMDPHHHFICVRCGMIRDFHDEGLDDYEPPECVEALGTAVALRIEVRGVCKQCGKTRS